MSASLKMYVVYDVQFHVFSDPFLSADDDAAERLMTQTALLSEGFRKRLVFSSLFCLGSYDALIKSPLYKSPLKSLKRPRLVSGSVRLMDLVDAVERAQKAHQSSVSSPSDSYLFEKSKDQVDGDAFLEKHCSDDFPELVEKEDSVCE